eukprot:scaffold108372_cov63-Phaeocystis_antarctica.AAC.2
MFCTPDMLERSSTVNGGERSDAGSALPRTSPSEMRQAPPCRQEQPNLFLSSVPVKQQQQHSPPRLSTPCLRPLS